MITIQIFDKHGRELVNGHTIRYVEFDTIRQEYGDFGQSFLSDVSAKWVEITVESIIKEFNDDGYMHLPPFHPCHDADAIKEFYELLGVDFDEYKECIIDPICEDLGLVYTTEEKFYEDINGFEIVESMKDENLTREQAQVEFMKGRRISHRLFSPDEYINLVDGKMMDESGIALDPVHFWIFRSEKRFDDGWFIWTGINN